MSQKSINENKDSARRYIETVWNQHDSAAVKEFFAPGVVRDDPATGVHTGIEGVKQVVASLLASFPDLHFTVEQQIAEGDSVVTRWSSTGTHLGDFQGISPTGKKIALSGISIYQYADGVVIAEHSIWDALGLLKQIGAIQ
jgi:steroid delta-isomerase-like uncharacterized protein